MGGGNTLTTTLFLSLAVLICTLYQREKVQAQGHNGKGNTSAIMDSRALKVFFVLFFSFFFSLHIAEDIKTQRNVCEFVGIQGCFETIDAYYACVYLCASTMKI